MAVGMDISRDSYKALLRRGQELCDFCDRKFKNRFDSIVHNASHIIIPLIKQNWFQCDMCLYYFPSREDLDDHHKTIHPDIAINTQKANRKYKSKIKFEDPDEYDIDDRYNSVVKIEDSHNLTNSIIKHENDADGHIIKEESYRLDDSIDIKNVTIKVESSDCDNGIIDLTENDERTESIKNRLRFEDDGLFDDSVFNDMDDELINGMPCFKNLNPRKDINNMNNSKNVRNNPVQNLISDIIKSNFHDKPIQNGIIETNKVSDNNVCNDSVTDDYDYDNSIPVNTIQVDEDLLIVTQNIDKHNTREPEYIQRSVHFQDLTKPGIFRCRYCLKMFPNRLSLIQHEPSHIHIKRPRPLLCTYCDKFIPGNYVQLRRHIMREHPGAPVDKKHRTYKCERCGLRFRRYLSHVRNYHPYDCHGCGKEYERDSLNELNQHTKKCTTQSVLSKVLNVCDLCFRFFKAKLNLKYILLGTTENEPGVRYPCAVCGKQYFELKMIKRVLYGAVTSASDGAVSARCEYRCKKKPMTNEERLKKFQHRLKKINYLNKFYIAVLFSLFQIQNVNNIECIIL